MVLFVLFSIPKSDVVNLLMALERRHRNTYRLNLSIIYVMWKYVRGNGKGRS